MSVNELAMELEDAALSAVVQAKAAHPCPFHEEILIRVGDDDAERHAYALATTILKRDGTMYLREELMPAIKDVLDLAADGECPQCAHIRDE